ncbi:DivIVA domain-containing protein [Mycoplasmopsis agassizii]|uniref:Uncharacterized protein n=1 Tax=Mycoplasmopsis agassizii TaxID=33922 RepID=A0A1W1WW41_9BACT|nr:DivIVA domain-containing protein [Mycoplasmopsis agassizii]PAF55351.1 hypothetical protein CJF60_01525 [Mycoplasmopsis agassizii]PAK21694.1 hypothetical protein CJJ23_00980 [Mycoplasmopsis agassizii]SMC15827.1 DivIVA protein [Mycoplasmopsis agassizii]
MNEKLNAIIAQISTTEFSSEINGYPPQVVDAFLDKISDLIQEVIQQATDQEKAYDDMKTKFNKCSQQLTKCNVELHFFKEMDGN